MLKTVCNCCPSFNMELQRLPQEPLWSQRVDPRHLLPKKHPTNHSKQRHKQAKNVFLFVKAWASITNTKRNWGAQSCQETPEPSQDNTRHEVLRRVKQRDFCSSMLSSVRSQHHRQRHQPRTVTSCSPQTGRKAILALQQRRNARQPLIPTPFSPAMEKIYHDTLYLAERLRQERQKQEEHWCLFFNAVPCILLFKGGNILFLFCR